MEDNNDKLSTSFKYLALGVGAALGHGSYRAFNLSRHGIRTAQALRDHVLKPIGEQLTKQTNFVNKEFVPSNFRDNRLLPSGLLRDISELNAIGDAANLDSKIRAAVSRNYRNRRLGDKTQLVVSDLLNSIDRSNVVTLKTGDESYEAFQTSLGFNVKTEDVKALERAMLGDNPLVTGNTLLGKNLYKNKAGQAYKSFGLDYISDVARTIHIPVVNSNPLDILLPQDNRLAQRLTKENMADMGYGNTPGAFVEGNIYRVFPDRSTEFLGAGRVVPLGSAREKAKTFGSEGLRKPKDFRTKGNITGLVEQGFYDKPYLQALAKPILKNKAFQSVFGKQSFVYEPGITNAQSLVPLSAKLDMWASRLEFNILGHTFKPFEKISGRYLQHENILTQVANYGSETADDVRRYILEHDAKYNFIDPNLKSIFKKKVPTPVDIVLPGYGTYGRLDPNSSEVAANKLAGRLSSSKVSPSYIAMRNDPRTRITTKLMEAINPTVGLFESMTGIGIGPMSPQAVIGTAIAGTVGLAVASDALSAADAIVEKLNPFGDVGVKKTSLYMYAAGRTAQQYMLNMISPIFAPLELIGEGFGDSLAGQISKAVVGYVLGNRFGGKAGGMLGAAFLGTMEANKPASERWDEYTGKKLVGVRENRFWGLGPQDWRGGDIKYFRKSLIANELSGDKFDAYGGHVGYLLNASTLSLPTRMIGGITGLGDLTGVEGFDPYAVEKKNYYNQPYPLTGPMFENVPIVGDILGATIGEVFKPTKLMHRDHVASYYQNRFTKADELTQLAAQLGADVVRFKKEIPRTKNLMDAFGSSMDKLMDFFGMRGYLISTMKEVVTGDKTFAPEGLVFKDAGELTNVAKRYNDMELGGLFGGSELTRRILTRNRTIDTFNPLDPNYDNPFYHFDRVANSAGNPYTAMNYQPGSGNTSDEYLSWTARGADTLIPKVPYLFSKLYGNRTPLEAYKDKVTISSDFYNWSDPYSTILAPYLQSAEGTGPVTGILKGGALAIVGRTAISRTMIGGTGAIFGLGQGITDPEIHQRELDRRNTEQAYDSLEYQKIEKLKQLAKDNNRGDILTKLDYLQSKTMIGLDYSLKGQGFLNQAYVSLPKADRRYLMDLANAPVDQRKAILEGTPEYLSEILQHVWSKARMTTQEAQARRQVAAQDKLDEYGMPGDSWAGWTNGVDINKIKLASVHEAGRDLHDYGFWGSDERDYKRNYSYLNKVGALPSMGSYGTMMSGLSNNYSMRDFKLDVGASSVDRNDFEAEYQKDRSAVIMQRMTNTGRY